jgi:RNA polymerase sigma-70 factor (ECF subfamily)
VAEVFLVAWRRIAAVPAGDAARAWLYATARRVTANQRRARRRRVALVDRIGRERPTVPAASPPADGDDPTVHAALDLLGDRDREVLLLVEWEGLRPAGLATVLGCREVTARGRLHRARRRFREAFDVVRSRDAGPAPPPPRPPSWSAGPAAAPLPSREGSSTPHPTHIVHLTNRPTMRKAQP